MKSKMAILAALLATGARALEPMVCADGARLTGAAPPQGRQQQCVLADGTLHGEQRVWYHDGKLMEQRHFDHGREHGEQKGWWPNGQLMMQGVSVQGKRYNGFRFWDLRGKPAQIDTVTIQEDSVPGVSDDQLQQAVEQAQRRDGARPPPR